MSDASLNRFLASGTNAERLAFTPSPPTPASGPDPTYLWHETDTGDTYAWDFDGATWNVVNNGSGALIPANNLSDVASAATARTNLGLAIGTDVQAYDAGLSSLGGLSTTGKIYYLSAADTWSPVTVGTGLDFTTGTLSATGGGASGDLMSTNNLSDLANAGTALTNLGGTTIGKNLFTLTNPSAITFPRYNADNTVSALSASSMRTALGLVIGTDVQAQDAELAAIAGLTSASDRLPYFTGSGTASLATFTSAGRALVDDADAAAQRATLGIDKQSLALPLTFNFTAAGDAYFYADEAMTVTEQATVGTGTIAYAKGTTAAPTTFSSTTSPISLQAGAWFKVSASSVTGGVAVHLKRTA